MYLRPTSFQSPVVLLRCTALVVWGCGRSVRDGSSRSFATPKAELWRASEEQACLSSGYARSAGRVEAHRSSLGGPAPCGAIQPFDVSELGAQRVALKPVAILQCPMVPAVKHWLDTSVAPAARRHLGSDVVEIKVAASYACRPINHKSGSRLSEHGRANALDVSGFRLADGRMITVKYGWWGEAGQRNFLREVHRGGCRTFTTVLGPNADRYHHDHFHFDLARHGRDGTYRVCR